MLFVPRIPPHTWIPLAMSCGLVAGSCHTLGGGTAPALLGVCLGAFALGCALGPRLPLRLPGRLWRRLWLGLGQPANASTGTSLLPLLRVLIMALAAFVLGQVQSGAAPAPFGQEPREQVVQGRVERNLAGGVLVCRTQRVLAALPLDCIVVRMPPPAMTVVGDRIAVRGRLRAPATPLNPFDFNEQQWVRSLGASGLLDDVTALHTTRNTSAHDALRLRYRERVAARFHAIMPTPLSRALARALWLADRSSIPEDVQTAFADSGLAHVLAVSGLHVGFVALALLAALRMPLRRLPTAEHRRRQLAGLAAAGGLVLFGWWTGPAASVDRAVIMGSALLLSRVFLRKPSPGVAFAWALLLSLFMAPTAWQSVGWQLSFSAVGAILLVLPWLSRLRRRPVASSLVVTAAAWLGTAPVLVLHFGQAPAAGAALSPIAVPLMAPLLLTTLASLFDPGPVFLLLTEALAAALHALARFGMAWPAWTRWSAAPGTFSPLLAVPWILLWMLRPGRSAAEPRRRTRQFIIGLWILACLVFAAPRNRPPLVQHLHVGQGDASIIMIPDTRLARGRTLVIDSGPSNWTGAVVARHVSAWGRRRIDRLIHSHEHADHTGGTPRLAHLLPILDVASQHTLRRGNTVDVGPAARLYVLGPAQQPIYDANNDSVVLRLQVGPRSWLFMGDAEAAAERWLVRDMGPFLDVDVVKVGHHGSSTSSIPAFIQRTTPETVIMSAGRDNRFSHPHPDIVQRWRASGARVHITFQHGAWISGQ